MNGKRGDNRKAAAAFLRYARLGLDTIADPVARAARIRGCAGGESERRELFAVWETLYLLAAFDRMDCVRAVRALWMTDGPALSCFAVSEGCSERAVYRRLAEARDCWERLTAGVGGETDILF